MANEPSAMANEPSAMANKPSAMANRPFFVGKRGKESMLYPALPPLSAQGGRRRPATDDGSLRLGVRRAGVLCSLLFALSPPSLNVKKGLL
jgi:hypothetical protein